MSLGREIDPWGTNPGDLIDAALKAIETALQDLLATDPAYWRTGQKKDLLERLEKLQAQQAALKLRVLAIGRRYRRGDRRQGRLRVDADRAARRQGRRSLRR